MISIKFVTVGNLKEAYLRDAAAEYEKRLGGFCRFESVCLKEEKLPDSPTDSEIDTALKKESAKIRAELSPKAYKIAMCVEGGQMSSAELAKKIDSVSNVTGEICFVIGSSHGLDESVKRACDLRLSVSKLTFPHQLMRVILLEAVYRALNINRGTKYHK